MTAPISWLWTFAVGQTPRLSQDDLDVSFVLVLWSWRQAARGSLCTLSRQVSPAFLWRGWGMVGVGVRVGVEVEAELIQVEIGLWSLDARTWFA